MYVIDSYSLNVCINIIYVERITCLGVAPCDPSSRISRDSVQLLIKLSWNETLIGLMPMAGRFHMKIYFKTEISVSYNCIHVPIRILWIWYVTGKTIACQNLIYTEIVLNDTNSILICQQWEKMSINNRLPVTLDLIGNIPAIGFGISDGITKKGGMMHQFLWDAPHIDTCPSQTPCGSWKWSRLWKKLLLCLTVLS